jgi:hypothetical protein
VVRDERRLRPRGKQSWHPPDHRERAPAQRPQDSLPHGAVSDAPLL